MADPFTLSFIAANCVWGAVKGLSGQAAIAGAKRLAEAIRNSQTRENHDLLAATHAAFVRSIQFMADACDKSGSNPKDQFSARALSKLAKAPDFTTFRFDKKGLPKRALDASIRSLFLGADPDPTANVTAAVIAQVEQGMGEPLTEPLRALFRQGSDKHRSWPQAFELFFAEEVKEKQRVFNILALDRLNEIVAFAMAHESDLATLHDQLSGFRGEVLNRFDRVDRANEETRERLARMEGMLATQTGVPLAALREIARQFGEIQPSADVSTVEDHLRAKAKEYHVYRERAEAIEARDNRSRVLLGQAQDAIDSGRFDEADQLIGEAELHDEEIGRELRLTADQRDIDRSAKRALRGDAAKLSGNYEAAIAHYDAAAEMLPKAAADEWFERKFEAAQAAEELGEIVDPDWLDRAVNRLRSLRRRVNRKERPVRWAMVENAIGVVLAKLARGEEGQVSALKAMASFKRTLRVCTREERPIQWAFIQGNLGSVLQTLGNRTNDAKWYEGAVKAYELVLIVQGHEKFPIEWAMTQNNLGNALQKLGNLSGDAATLRKSVAAHKSALKIRTRDKFPRQWGNSQNNLGTTLAVLGMHESGTDNLEASAGAFRRALEVRSHDTAPQSWAITMANLGRVLLATATRTRKCDVVRESIKAFQGALVVFSHPKLAWQRASAEEGLRTASDLRDQICDRP